MTQRKSTILIVDDDEELRRALAEQLEVQEDFRIDQAGLAAEGIEKAKEGGVNLILLDVHLPDMDGREACKDMRRAGVRAPIIMLTGADGESDVISGFESGANDYVTKPFRFSLLLARVRAHLNSHEQSENAVFAIGPYEFRPASKMLIDPKMRKIRLTEKETNVLKYLYRASSKAVAREELLREVWGYNATVTTHTLETHIYRLRQKIEQDPNNLRLLLTEGGGYRLMS